MASSGFGEIDNYSVITHTQSDHCAEGNNNKCNEARSTRIEQ
jgi:hypothetical protein